MAEAWKKKMATTKGRGNKPRSAHYVNGLLGGLSALWQKWFVDAMNVCQGNPWQDVDEIKADKIQVEYATDEQIENLYKWIAERFRFSIRSDSNKPILPSGCPFPYSGRR